MLRGSVPRRVVYAGVAASAITAYVLRVVPRMRRWGATADELARTLPGDDIVPAPMSVMTMGVTIHARPEEVWPWLVQIGYRRGGLYSYDWLDRLFGILDRPSADELLPEFQHLEAGDVIPLGAGPSWPVATAEPNRALVLAPASPGFEISWAFVLDPVDASATRLVTRVRTDYERRPTTLLMAAILDPTSFIMTRRMLLGIKERAERLASMPSPRALRAA